MKNIFTLFILISCTALSAQEITYISYGDGGIAIPLDAAYEYDMDQDGTVDFMINQFAGELALTSIPIIGCFLSPSETATVHWGASEIKQVPFSETIALTLENMNTYEEDNRGGLYSVDHGAAAGIAHGSEFYIGVALMAFEQFSTVVKNGWIKVRVDLENEELILLSAAYNEAGPIGSSPTIKAGEKGASSTKSVDISSDFSSISMTPSPATDYVNISFDYQGDGAVNFSVVSADGKLVYDDVSSYTGKTDITLDVSSWTRGVYLATLTSSKGLLTQRLLVTD